jgi:hypothetical protein
LRIGIGSRGQERNPQLVGILGGETERTREDPRLVFATRVFGAQAVSRKLLWVDNGGLAAWHFHGVFRRVLRLLTWMLNAAILAPRNTNAPGYFDCSFTGLQDWAVINFIVS